MAYLVRVCRVRRLLDGWGGHSWAIQGARRGRTGWALIANMGANIGWIGSDMSAR